MAYYAIDAQHAESGSQCGCLRIFASTGARDPKKDFTGLGVVAWAASAILVPAVSSANMLRDFVTLAKSKPGMNYGNPGTGSSIHLSMELFKQVAGIHLPPIGYQGQPQVITDLMGGQLDAAFATIGLMSQHVQSGKLKALGVIGQTRSRQLPNLPPLIEAGYAEAGSIDIPEMATMVSSTGMDVGRSIAPVCHDYAPPFVFVGELRSATFDIAAARKAVVVRISE